MTTNPTPTAPTTGLPTAPLPSRSAAHAAPRFAAVKPVFSIPARYGKFVAALVGATALYLDRYGATWHLVPAFYSFAACLGVAGVPNAPKP